VDSNFAGEVAKSWSSWFWHTASIFRRYRPDLTVHPFVCHIIMLREPGFLPGNDNWIKVQCNHDLGIPLTNSASLSSHTKYHKNPTTWSLCYVTTLQSAGILWLPSLHIQHSDKGTQGDKFQLEAEVQEDLGDFIMTLHSTSRNAYSA
jgi:hypothetical protein